MRNPDFDLEHSVTLPPAGQLELQRHPHLQFSCLKINYCQNDVKNEILKLIIFYQFHLLMTVIYFYNKLYADMLLIPM